MSAETLSILSLACFAVGAIAAIAAFRVEALRSNALQFAAAGFGMLFKTAAIGMACSESHTHFFNSPSEMVGLLAWSLGFSYLVALVISAARSLGALIMPLVTLLGIVALFVSKQSVGIEVPAGRIFAIHVLSAFLGYGLFLTACGASLLYLEQARLLKRKMFGAIFRDLPSLERLERLEMVCSWLGLAIFSAAMITGAIMASEAGRPFWLEAKFLSAQVTWLVFLVLVIGRAARRLSGRTAAKCVLAGAALVLVTLALGHPFGRPQASAGWPTQEPKAVGSRRVAQVALQRLPGRRSRKRSHPLCAPAGECRLTELFKNRSAFTTGNVNDVASCAFGAQTALTLVWATQRAARGTPQYGGDA